MPSENRLSLANKGRAGVSGKLLPQPSLTLHRILSTSRVPAKDFLDDAFPHNANNASSLLPTFVASRCRRPNTRIAEQPCSKENAEAFRQNIHPHVLCSSFAVFLTGHHACRTHAGAWVISNPQLHNSSYTIYRLVTLRMDVRYEVYLISNRTTQEYTANTRRRRAPRDLANLDVD